MEHEVNGGASTPPSGTSPLQNGMHSSSFLTKAQQAALDAALEKKEKTASAYPRYSMPQPSDCSATNQKLSHARCSLLVPLKTSISYYVWFLHIM